MKTILLTAILSICGLAAVAQQQAPAAEGDLLVRLADQSGATPVPSAFIFAHALSGDDNVVGESDKDGTAELHLAPGFYDVLVSTPGFAPASKRIVITAGKRTTLEARLTPDHEPTQ